MANTKSKTKTGTIKKPQARRGKVFCDPKAEAAFKSARLYRSLFNAMTESFALRELVFDKKGKAVDSRFIEINPSFEKFLGVPRTDIVGKLRSKVPVPQNVDSFRTYAKVARTGRPARFESYNKALDKYFSVYVYRPEHNQFATIFTDVTDRKHADKEIRHLASFPDNNPNPIIEIDAAGKIIFANTAAQKTISSLKPKAGIGVFLPPNIDAILKSLNKRNSRQLCFFQEITVGSKAFAEDICVLKETNSVRIYAKDITERKLAENAAWKSEEKFRTVADFTYDWENWLDTDGNYIYVSPSCERITGYRAADFMKNPRLAAEIVHPEDKAAFENHRSAHRYNEKNNFGQIDFRIVTAKGETKWISHVCQSVFGKNGELLGRRSSNRDITARKLMEEKLRESEIKYRGVFENIGDMLGTYEAIRDEKGKIIERKLINGNPAMVRDAGAKSIEDIRGKTVTQIYGSDYASDTIGAIRKIIDSRKTGHLEAYFANTDKNYLTTITPISDNFYLAATKDITIIKRAQANLNRLNRTLKALNGVNHAILNAKSEKEFLNEVCRIIIQDCGHKMVWIGFANDDKEKSVKPAAYAGFESGYLKTLNITWDDNERGQGPTGTAIRTGRAQQCKNMTTDPKFAPWRDEALKRGYASSISLPTVADQQTFGALTIYSKDPDPFTDDEISLLTELANDTAHGISTLRLRKEHSQTVRNLRETSEYLDNLLTYANAPIIVWDPSFKITRFNRALEDLTGIKARQAIGKPLEIIFPEQSKRESMDWIKNTLAGKNWETVEIPIVRKNGDVRTVIWNSANIKGGGEKVVATIAQGQDVTARKIAEGQRERAERELKEHAAKLEKAVADLTNLQLAVENASDIIFIADFQGTILSINKAAETILGYGTSDMVGKNISLFGNPVDPDFYRKMWQGIKKGGRIFSGEVANTSQDGKQRIFDLKTSPVINRSGRILFFVGIMRDKTEAKEIDRAKTEFISLVAHQLRTPLSTMTMAAEMILNGNIGEVDSAAQEQLRTIYNSAYHMAGLIELFLNLSRIELGRLEIDPEPVGMDELADDVLKDILPQARAKNIIFETYFEESLPIINLDRRIMHIALENILTNAIKYTPAGGKIVFAARVENGKIVYSVTDTGCGIPKTQAPLIFTKMFRADNVGEVKGMGLGLNMTKNSIEQSGGQVWFQSEENKGSTFSIAIPLSGMKKKSIRMES